ncbi:MAG: ABC transporter substrate-binding protein [Eubacteriales bacterium]|nr:ABC transporter substrate-binding protein [Eubacteriales bacterium]
MKKLTALLLALVLLLANTAAFAGSAAPEWSAFDELIAKIKSTTDFVEREALMHQAEDMLMETGAIMPLYYYNDIFMAKSSLTGYYYNAYGFKFFQHASNGDKNFASLNIASEPDKLDPALNSSVDGAIMAIASFGGLYTYDENQAVVPNFATGSTVSEDGLTYTFTMREGLQWSDGTPLTAADFEYSWKRAAASETAADYSYMFDVIKGFPDNLAVTASEDGTTLTVELNSPCAYMLDLAAFPAYFAVPKHAVEAAEGYKDASGKVVNPGAWALEPGFPTSGAYTLTEWKHDESMVYTKNPNYYDAANVKLERLEFMLSADSTVTYAAYNAGNLDFIDDVPTDEIANVKDTEEFHSVGQLGTYYAIFNVNSPLFEGKTVEQANAMRKAFAVLANRDYIVEVIGNTGQVPANAFIPAGMANGHGGEFKVSTDTYSYPVAEENGYYTLNYDEDKAVETAVTLLKEAGYEFDENNMLSASTPISFEYLTNVGKGHEAVAQALQQDFAAIGINMTIKNIDWKVFLNERKAGNFDFARNGWIADFNDPINMLEMWTTASGNNDAQFGK